jgi:hypothetical protein
LAELPRLLSATGHVISECESDEELRFLLASPIMLMIGSHGVMACRHLPSPLL